MATEPIRMTARFTAPPEALFDAFTVKADLEAWFAAHAEIDAVEGGTWHYTWPPHMAAKGTIIKVDRPHQLIWTWEESIMDATLEVQPTPEFAMPVVTIHYVFERDGDVTMMHIEESGHGTEEIRAMNEQGIGGMIGTLRAWVERGERVDWSAGAPE